MTTTTSTVSSNTPEIVVRKPNFPFKASAIPNRWFGDNVIATHVTNALNLVFPAGERFFIRSVKRYMSRIDDPKLAAEVRGFFQQEAMHGREHERFFEVLREQGYQIDGFL